jgi:penicillin-binding protein 1C
VWVGNFDRRELRNSSGVTGAAPIFHAVMLAATKRVRGTIPVGDDAPIVEPPADLEVVPICGISGLRPSTYCPSVEQEWLPKGARAQFCSWHHDGYEDLPGEYREWRTGASPVRTAARGQARTPVLHVTNPFDGATYLIDPTLRSSYQALHLRATADAEWHVDGKKVAEEWPLVPGVHTIVAVDGRGNRDSVKIFVK